MRCTHLLLFGRAREAPLISPVGQVSRLALVEAPAVLSCHLLEYMTHPHVGVLGVFDGDVFVRARPCTLWSSTIKHAILHHILNIAAARKRPEPAHMGTHSGVRTPFTPVADPFPDPDEVKERCLTQK